MNPRSELGDIQAKKAAPSGLRSVVFIFLAIFMCTGCSSLGTGNSRRTSEPEDQAARLAAQAVLSRLNNQNNMLLSFKGIGTIKVWQGGKLSIDERVAWIGSEKNRLSLVVMISGYPAVKMASDGKWFYYYEAQEGQPIYKKIRTTDASLKRIIPIPIKTSDVINLLAGRVPLRQFDSAFLTGQDSAGGYVLVLKKRWWGITEKIFIDATQTHALQIESYNRSQALIYRARFDKMQSIEGFRVPSRLSISNGKEADIQLDVSRYWANVHVSPSMFVLNPPN